MYRFAVIIYLLMSNVEGLGWFLKNRKHDIPPPRDVEVKNKLLYTKYFSQKLDHYNPTDVRVWEQRYFVSTDFFNVSKNNVAFLMLGGESQASEAWMVSGAWQIPAEEHGALLFQLEHRFYGESQPFEDLSLPNLQYLSSIQALGDVANFISSMNEEYKLGPDVKWILFGGSYSASLAAWARLKYPHLVDGVMSASGPLLAKLDFSEYMKVVVDDLRAHSQQCVDAVTVAMGQVESALKGPSEENNLTSIFNLCGHIEENADSTLDVANFFQTITVIFAAAAQYDNVAGGTLSIDNVCGIMTDESLGTEIYRLAKVQRVLANEGDCVEYTYENELTDARNITLMDGILRQWLYQTCTEYGWYQTTNEEVEVFGNTIKLDYFISMCVDLYGSKFNETYISKKVQETNIDYGGLDIEASNIVHVHGSLDPWHAMGLTKTRNPNSSVIIVNGTAHCASFYSPSEDDPPQLTAAREEVNKLISLWLEEN